MMRSMCAISRLLPSSSTSVETNSSNSFSKLRVFDFRFLAEIDQFTVDAVARRPPAIFIE